MTLVQEHDRVQSCPKWHFQSVADIINQPINDFFPALLEWHWVILTLTSGIDGIQLLGCECLSHFKRQ